MHFHDKAGFRKTNYLLERNDPYNPFRLNQMRLGFSDVGPPWSNGNIFLDIFNPVTFPLKDDFKKYLLRVGLSLLFETYNIFFETRFWNVFLVFSLHNESYKTGNNMQFWLLNIWYRSLSFWW